MIFNRYKKNLNLLLHWQQFVKIKKLKPKREIVEDLNTIYLNFIINTFQYITTIVISF